MAFKQFTPAEYEASRERELKEQQAAEAQAKVITADRMVVIDALMPLVSRMSTQDARFFDGLMLDKTYFDRHGVAGGSLARLSDQRAEGLRILVKRYMTADAELLIKEHLTRLYGPDDSSAPSELGTLGEMAAGESRHALDESLVHCSTGSSKLCSENIGPNEKAEDRCIQCPDRLKCEEEARGY